MDPLTLIAAITIGSIFFLKKGKVKKVQVTTPTTTILNVRVGTPAVIEQTGLPTATAPASSVVVLALPSDWRGTAKYQGIIWEEQGSPDGPDFMFKRDQDWVGEAYFSVEVRNSYGQHVGNVTVNFVG